MYLVQNNLSRFAAALSLLCCSSVSAADEPPVIVITPSQVDQPLKEVGSTIYKLDAESLRQRGVQFVADALREVPALVVTSYGAIGSQVQLRVRGNEANHVLILIDGVRVANATTGEYDLANLSLNGIDHIEVLLGPQSTIYGSDAIAGVINILTQKGRGDLSGNVSLEVAKRSEHIAAANMGGESNGFNYAFSVQDMHTDGISAASSLNGNTEPDAFDEESGRLRMGYRSEKFIVDLSAGKTRTNFDFDGYDLATGMAKDEKLNHQTTEVDEKRLLLTIPGNIKQEFFIGKATYDYKTRTVSSFSGSLDEYSALTDRDSFIYRLGYQVNQANYLQMGVERVDESLNTHSSWSDFDGKVVIKGAYLNWLFHKDGLSLSAGARGNEHDEFGSFSTWRTTASYQYTDKVRLKFAAGTGFKAPSLQELYDPTFGGNASLKPEESKSVEAGIEIEQKGYLMVLTGFDQNTTNLIRYTGVWPNARNENVGEANSKGIEIKVQKNWSDVSFDLSISRINADETVSGVTKNRLRVPEWSGNSRITLFHDKGSLWLEVDYKGKRRDYNFATSKDITLDAYSLWKLGASVRLNPELTVTARIDNLTNEVYEEVYSYGVPDRTVRLSARWAF